MEISGRKQVDSDCTKTFIPCDPCQSVHENQTAECFCTECNEYLCSDCTRAHKKVTVSLKTSGKLVGNIKQFRTEINTLLDSLETKISEKIRTIKREDLKRMRDLSSQLDSLRTELNEMRTQVENLYETKQDKKLVITFKITDTKIDLLEKNVNDLSKLNMDRDYQFHPNEGLFEAIESVKELGFIREEIKTEKAGNGKITREVSSKLLSTPNRNPVKLTHQRDIDIRLRGDQHECCITGSVLMDSNRLVVVDQANKGVKVIDIIQDSVSLHISLDKYPCDITYTDQNQLVVTAAQFLVFLNVGKTLTVNKKLNVVGQCRGIDYTDKMLIVTFIYPCLVKFINIDGQVMKSICTDVNGKPLFVWPSYVITSRDKEAVYVTDRNQSTVTKLDMNGTVIDVYNSKDLVKPYGVTVDKYDNVYIAGWRSDNIYVLTAGGRHIQPIPQVYGPQSVVVCDDLDQIIVSQYCKSSSRYVIRVYNIQREDADF